MGTLLSHSIEHASKSTRIVWVDFARAFAICVVVLCHATQSVFSFQLAGIGTADLATQVCGFTLFTIGSLGVPVFLFMSGYLMLDRDYDAAACKRFWKTKWIPLVVATEIWIVVYDLFLCWFRNEPLGPLLLLKNMLFLEKVDMGHMWYMPMIIGLYLFLPFIANGLKSLDRHSLLNFPLTVAICIFFATPIASVLYQCLGKPGFETIIASGFSGGAYGCYMLLGYCVKKDAFKKLRSPIIAIMGILSFCAVVALQIFAYSKGVRYNVWYTNGLLLVAGLAVYELLSRAQTLKPNRVVSILSFYSFAIYLVHYPVNILLLEYFLPWAPIASQPHIIQVCLQWLLMMAISLLLCGFISRIPKVGSRILYLR